VIRAARLLDQFRPARVRVWTDSNNPSGIGIALSQVAPSRNIPCECYEVPSGAKQSISDFGQLRSRIFDRLEGERECLLSQFTVTCPQPSPKQVRILAVEFYFSHANFILPIFHSLKESGPVDTMLLAFRPKVADHYAARGVQILPAYRIVDRQTRARLKELAARTAPVVAEFISNKALPPLPEVTGVDLGSLTGPRLRQILIDTHQAAATAVEQCQRIIDQWRPHVLISTTEVSLHSRTAFAVAAANNLPSVSIQHGIMYSHPLNNPMVTTHQALWGEGAAEILAKDGNPLERLVLTGCPSYDNVVDASSGISPSVRALFPRNPPSDGSFEAVYTTQPAGTDYSQDERDRSVKAIVRAAQAFPQSHWIFKLHPADAPAPYRKIIKSCGARNIEILKAPDVIPVLARAHLVVTLFSTTGIEAMLLDKPLIQMNLSGHDGVREQYASWGAALAVRSESEMVDAVQRALWNPGTVSALSRGRQAYLDKFVGRRDGRSSQRVAHLILDLVAKNGMGA
jgi:hypothetical protein